MSKLLELREKCDTLAAEIKRFADKANDAAQDFTAEDEANFQTLNTDYDSARAAYDAEKRRADIGARSAEIERERQNDRNERRAIGRGDFRSQPSGGRAAATDEDRGIAMRSWFLAPKRGLEDAEIQACHRVGIDPYSPEIDLRLGDTQFVNEARAHHRAVQTRALSAQTGASGAFTVQDGLLQPLELAMLAFGGMRQVAEVIRTDTGAEIPYPTSNDTSNTGEIIGENTAVSEQDVSFGAVTIGAHKYSSKMVKVPVELLEDSAFNIAAMLGNLLGERLGRITNTHFTTGDGAAKPRGITTMTTLGKTTAGATAITMDEVIDLIHSVDQAYRIGAGFMLKDSTLALLRKLKDGQGQYLWTRGTQAGEPDQIWNYPYTINQDMPAATSGLKSMLFGQLSKYKIREVRTIRLRRLVERYAEYDQEAFVAFIRNDGVLVDAGTNPVKHMLQA